MSNSYDKSFLKSKTFWTNIVIGAASFIPPVKEFLVSNPETAVSMISAINVVLRFISKGKIFLN
jgi:hypothetical protein